MESEVQRDEVTGPKPQVPLTLVSHHRSLPGTFFPLTPHLKFSERQVMQQRALGSGGSWQAVGGHPKGNSFSSGAGRVPLAEPEAILGSQPGQGGRLSSSGEGTSLVESVLRAEVSSGVGHPLWRAGV